MLLRLTAIPQVLTVCTGHWNKPKLNINIGKSKTKASDEQNYACVAEEQERKKRFP